MQLTLVHNPDVEGETLGQAGGWGTDGHDLQESRLGRRRP